MPKSTAHANTILNHELGAVAYTPPATWYVALFTTAPNADGAGWVEVVAASYARVAVTNNATNWPAATNRQKTNGLRIDWGTPTEAWGTAVSIGLFTTATGGAPLYFGAIGTPEALIAGRPVYADPGALVVTEQ